MKILYIILGFIGLGLGALGAALPLLPAFPFLLLAAWAFAKSSKRLNDWFIATDLYKNNIKDWKEQRAMTKEAKIRVITIISLTMLFGFVMMSRVPVGRIILLIVWIGHLLYFRYGIRTLKPVEAE